MTIRQKIIIIVLTLIAVVGLVTYYLLIPSYVEIEKISKAIEDEKKDLEIKYKRGQLIRKVREGFKEIEKQKLILDSVYISSGQELDYITQLEILADMQNIQMNLELSEKQIVNIDGRKIIPLRVKINGDYIKVLKFLEEIERQSQYLNISELSFDNMLAEEGGVSAVLSAKVYSKNAILP